MKDEVISEMHKIKDDIAREHRNDVRAMLQSARKRQATGRRVVSRAPQVREAA